MTDTINAYIISFLSVFITALFGGLYTKKEVNSKWYQCIKP